MSDRSGRAVRAWRGLLAAGVAGLVAAGWAASDAGPPFHNLHGADIDKSFVEVLRWNLSRVKPEPPEPPLPAAEPQLDAPRPHATWIGHASMLLRLPSGTLLTDPQFSERASPVNFLGPKRAYPPGVSLAQLPHVDAVLISHNHYDHLDRASVRALAAQPGGSPWFIVPLGLKAWFLDEGITQVVELGWWQSHRVGGIELTLTPAHHWSARGLWDRRQTLWGGFAIFGDGLRMIYTGDTGYAEDFKDIARHWAGQGGFDFAMIPVGCYEPRDFMKGQHINPAEAVQVFQDLGARQAVGVHWGTFTDLCDEPLDQAPKDLAVARQAAGLAEDAFTVWRRGETRPLTVRH